MEKNPPSLEEIYEKYERCGKRKITEKKLNLNKKKRKRGEERKSQRNQKSDNGVPGKSFRFTRAPRRNPVGGGEAVGRQKQKRKKAYEEGRLGGEDRGRSGKEGLKLLADISSGEQAR